MTKEQLIKEFREKFGDRFTQVARYADKGWDEAYGKELARIEIDAEAFLLSAFDAGHASGIEEVKEKKEPMPQPQKCCQCFGKSPEIVSSNTGMIDGHICFCICHKVELVEYASGKITVNGIDNTPTPQNEKSHKPKSEVKCCEKCLCKCKGSFTAHYGCDSRICECHTPASTEEWQTKWIKTDAYKMLNFEQKLAVESFISSHDQQLRQRIVEGLEKMQKDRTFTNFLRHDIADQCLGYYNQAISDAIKLITNLK